MTVGVDCDISLTHASVNGAVAYGFILRTTTGQKANIKVRGSVKIKREAYDIGAGLYQDRLGIECVIVLGDNLIDPNGAKHTQTRAQMYAMLLDFLSHRSAITLIHAGGTITSLCATLVTAREEVFLDRTEVTLFLNDGVTPQGVPEDYSYGPIAILMGTIDGVISTNTGVWASAPVTLAAIGNLMATPGGQVSAYDPSTGWKIITRVGAAWIGDTTYIVYSGTVISFSGCVGQHFYLPWMPTLEQFGRVLQASDFLMGGMAGATGTITTDTEVVTVTKGIITVIV